MPTGVGGDPDDAAGWDFFVSYTQADRVWAEWISWVLEAAGHRVLVQAWDFVPGSNWIAAMQAGAVSGGRTIAVLSPDYLMSVFGGAEWQAAWASDPTGATRALLPVRVRECTRPGLLAGVVGIDLFDIDEARARRRLLDAVAHARAGRRKPVTAPAFPGALPAGRTTAPPFPGRAAPESSVPGPAADARGSAGSRGSGAIRVVEVFLGWAPSDRVAKDQLVEPLLEQLNCLRGMRVRWWEDSHLQLGQDREQTLLARLDGCDFGVLLLSPAFLGNEFIRDVVLPRFVGPDADRGSLPVMLKQVPLDGTRDLHGLEHQQIFRSEPDGRAFTQTAGAARERFVTDLATRMHRRFQDRS